MGINVMNFVTPDKCSVIQIVLMGRPWKPTPARRPIPALGSPAQPARADLLESLGLRLGLGGCFFPMPWPRKPPQKRNAAFL